MIVVLLLVSYVSPSFGASCSADFKVTENSTCASAGTLSSLPANSSQECCSACQSHGSDCLTWVWLAKRSICKLKTACPQGGATKGPGKVVGTRSASPSPPQPSPSPGPTPPSPVPPPSRGPNIVTILGDDVGYFDAQGNPNATHPNLDALFKSGLKLSHHYAYKYCSPSRRAFVTGRWPLHLGEQNQLADGIDLRMTTLAQKLSGMGYTNYLFGKTHWGTETPRHLPHNRGWHSHLGFLGGGESYSTGHQCVGGDGSSCNCNNYTSDLDLWHDDHVAEIEYIGHYSTDLFTQLAVEAIQKHDHSGPFWLHLNYQGNHKPLTSPPGWPTLDNDGNKVLMQVLQRMDEGIGNITRVLKAGDLWHNTIILFLSDNGGAAWSNNYPLRGGKYSAFEGGMKVVAGLSGGILPKSIVGSTFDGLLHISDWYPTFCQLAGGTATYCKDDPPSDDPEHWFWPVDGMNVWPFLTQGAPDPRSGVPLVLSSPGFNHESSGPPGGAMIFGTHKIIYEITQTGWHSIPNSKANNPRIQGNSTCLDGTSGRDCKICSMKKPCLYDVWADEAEVHNLAEKLPDLVQKMNNTYTKLVLERRQPTQLNFTGSNGWACEKHKKDGCASHWGCYLGPNCWCSHSTDDCKVGQSVFGQGEHLLV